MRNSVFVVALLMPFTAQALNTVPDPPTHRFVWRPMTGCMSGTPDALKRSLTAKGITVNTGFDGSELSWTDPKDGQDEYADFFESNQACEAFRRSDDNDWFAYAEAPFGCVEVIPTQQQVIDFHRKKDPRVVARSYEDGNVVVITSRRPGSTLHIINIRGKKLCEMLGSIYYNAQDRDLSVMKSRNL